MDVKTKATIKRASAKARARLQQLDRATKKQLKAIYQQAKDDIIRSIMAAESPDGTVEITVKTRLLQQINARLAQLNDSRDALLGEQLRRAVDSGVAPFASLSANAGALADEALRQTVNFIAADGLQLSDRIWRLNQHQHAIISNSIEQAIIRGDSAARSAREFITQGLTIPADIKRKIGLAQAHKIAAQTGKDLMSKGSPYSNALRLFRTEINRAHGEAYQAAAFDSPDVIGTRFLLSPNHPNADICDMHANVNRYGLGKGVYPKGKNPWPAHPNTLSFTVVVFSDEVSAEDHATKQTRIDWLKQQSPARQQQVLGSRKKRAALHQGILKESHIATPWQTLKKRYQKQGVDIETLIIQNQYIKHPAKRIGVDKAPAGIKISSIIDPIEHSHVVTHALDMIDRVHGDGRLPTISVFNTTDRRFFGYYQTGASGRRISINSQGNHKELTAIHEIGHFIDHEGLPGNGFSSSTSPKMDQWRQAVANTPSVRALIDLFDSTNNPDLRAYLYDLLKAEELWARSYAQYIAQQSGSDILLRQLSTDRRKMAEKGIDKQWPEKEFEPVHHAIEELFRELKWIQ